MEPPEAGRFPSSPVCGHMACHRFFHENRAGSDIGANSGVISLPEQPAKMHRKNIRSLSLIVCTFTYLMIGAAVFDALESETDMKRRRLLHQLESKLLAKYNFSAVDYDILKEMVIKGIPHKAGLQWKFAGAFYFATVVITTVGYGHSTPATPQGRAFCMFYALAGIPLGLVMFQSIGERLNTLIAYILHKLKKCFGIKREFSATHLIMVSFTVGCVVIFLGTYVFHKKEHWSLFDAYYYCLITMSTIGFGDFVPLQKQEKLTNDPGYVVFTLVFILFGLAVFSASVNLFVLRFMATNTDPDPSDREPSKTIFLENFSQISSGDEERTPNGSLIRLRKSFMSPERSMGSQIPESQVLAPKSSGGASRTFICTGECRRTARSSQLLDKSKKKHRHYRVRRSPTRITHLLPVETDDKTSESDSFILYDLRKRDIS